MPNAIGPETFAWREPVTTIGALIGRQIAGRMRDEFITRDKICGSMAWLPHGEPVPPAPVPDGSRPSWTPAGQITSP